MRIDTIPDIANTAPFIICNIYMVSLMNYLLVLRYLKMYKLN